ncbi:hypothetical protein V6N13_137605 [Hibiscus sabdariffa]
MCNTRVILASSPISSSSSVVATATYQHDPPGLSGSGGTRYKLVAPAKLPISRLACITIPRGLSPSSFLESPVLLSDVKREAAAASMQGTVGNISVPVGATDRWTKPEQG